MMHDEVGAAVRNMLRRATLAGDASVDADHVRGTFTGRNGETFTAVPRISDYGFHSEPMKGASAILAALGGRSDGLLALGIDDPRKRPSLGPGAVALYNAQGNMISLVQQNIRIVSSQPIAVTAPSMTINGHTVQTI
jgi:phage baseplate assembly protein V